MYIVFNNKITLVKRKGSTYCHGREKVGAIFIGKNLFIPVCR